MFGDVMSLLFLHLLGASIWIGGHLILTLRILPTALKTRQLDSLNAYEQMYEPVGMTALALQVITGIIMAHRMLPDWSMWLRLDNDISIIIALKLGLLASTALVALHARFRVIPNLTANTLNFFALHVITITLLSVGFAGVGLLFRTGL